MPWPPTLPPTGRTNDTPTRDAHPSDHNTITQALTDVVAQVTALGGKVVLETKSVNAPQVPLAASLTDVLVVTIAPVAVPSRLVVQSVLYFTSNASVNVTAYVVKLDNTGGLAAGAVNGAANVYTGIPIFVHFDLAANENPSFKVRGIVNAGGGSNFALAYVTYTLVPR